MPVKQCGETGDVSQTELGRRVRHAVAGTMDHALENST